MNKQFVVSTGIILLSAISILFLSSQAVLLSILLIFIAFVKHTIYPIKRELLWFVMICFGGTCIEIVLVNIGHAWSYSTPQLLGIPVWMPLFWGVVGTTIVVLYDAVIIT
jgi:sterol desaturase/sphingolipid hydroxylase (fatty acid hydroxylase superfamily)